MSAVLRWRPCLSVMVTYCYFYRGVGQLPTLFLFVFLSLSMPTKANIIIKEKRNQNLYIEGVTDSLPIKTDKPLVDTAIRCACNLPKCVPFGYMCKSVEGACFIYYNETKTNFNKYTKRRSLFPLQGCIEDLPEETKEQCRRQASLQANEFSSYDIKKEGLTCCQTHVCNYEHAKWQEHPDYVQKIVDPSNTIRMSTEFFAGACVVAIPILGGIMFMLFLCLGRKMMLQERMYSPVQEISDVNKICNHSTTFVQCELPQPTIKYPPFLYLNTTQKLDYIAYKNAAYSLSSSSFMSRSLPELNGTDLIS